MVGLAGHGSKPLKAQLRRLEARRERLRSGSHARPRAGVRRLKRKRRPADLRELVHAVLGSAGELQTRDLHAAVQVIAGEDIPASSLRNWVAREATSPTGLVERAEFRGHYRLRRTR